METKGLSQKDQQSTIRRWKKKDNRRIKNINVKKKSKQKKESPENIEIILPEIFTLKNITQVIEKISYLRSCLSRDHKRMYLELNMDEIKEVDISTSLMLAAELECWSMQKGKLNSYDNRWNCHIRELFYEMGLFSLLKISSKTNIKSTSSVIKNTSFLHFTSGIDTDGEKIKQLRKEIENIIGFSLREEQKVALFTSLSEAIINTWHHAYKTGSKKIKKKRYEKWWISGSYNKRTKELIISLYDRGKTIPTTLQKRQDSYSKKIKNLLLLKQSSNITQTAMKYSYERKTLEPYTQTGERHRGKGLAQLLHLIEKKGSLVIISQSDHCCFDFINGSLEAKEYGDYISKRKKLEGTLIQWKLSL